jgi:hypothetical protein
MAVKHRKSNQRTKKIATIGAATATVTALTVGVAQPAEAHAAAVSQDVALSAATGPNYTQIITDSSDSLNNILFAAGNFGGAAASAWDPIASAFPAGLLPTFDASTTQYDLLTTEGLTAALAAVLKSFDAPDLSTIPGLPAGPASDITTALQVALAPLAAVTGVGGGALELVNTALGGLDDLGVLGGVPSLGSLIPGLQVTDTAYESSYNWALLGLSGQTNINNLFAQIPSITGSSLVTGILGGLTLAGHPITDPILLNTIGGILSPLDIINTPSITVWDPTGSGNYTFPLGGEIGWLATMPVLDVGPVDVAGVPLSTTDTVVAIPVFAGGVALPLNLATYGTVATPGLVLPTATGVSTLLGTQLQSFAIPLLGVSYTSLNTLQASYVGTNGFNYNSGQTIGLLTTPLGALPIVYSLGSVNAGTTGFGITLPSLFTIGALPPFQVGTAPTQQSPDGLLPASVLNLGLDVPTQTTNVATLLGLPDVGGTLSSTILTPLFNTAAAPLGAQLTNYLNNNVGSWADGLANFVKQLTGAVANASYNLPGANQPVTNNASTLAVTSTPQTTSPTLPLAKKLSLPTLPTTTTTNTTTNSVASNTKSTLADNTKQISTSANDARDRVNTSVTQATKQINDNAKKATKQISDTAKRAGDNLNNIAKQGQDAVKKTVAGTTQGAKDTADKATAGASSK